MSFLVPSISLFSFEFIAYVPDYKSYSKKPGLTIDYLQEFPGEVTFNESELIQALQATDSASYQKKELSFSRKHITMAMAKQQNVCLS